MIAMIKCRLFPVLVFFIGLQSGAQESFSPLPLSDTLALPFLEDWNSGSFSFNHWSFPNGQGNWQIWNTIGNPEPSAKFGGLPQKNNYSFPLESLVFMGNKYNCSEIYIAFDLKLVDFISSNTEKLRVEYFADSTWNMVSEYGNDGSLDWTHQKLHLPSASRNIFSVRFTAYGINSSRINAWYIDNIELTYECIRPENLEGYGYQTSWYLEWDPLICYGWNPSTYVYDDGTAENGWKISPGYLAWLGTEFPVEATASGVIQSVDVWFGWGPSSSGLSVDIFNGDHLLIGSSDPFTSPSEEWLNIPMNDIPFNGPFFAMVKWDFVQTNYFGYDENGPYASHNLEWYFDGTTWSHFSEIAGAAHGVFMIRVHGLQQGDDLDDTGNNFMYLVGYNVFRSTTGYQGPFIQRNSDYISEPEYVDWSPGVNCGSSGNPCYYIVTATFHDYSTDTLMCVTSSDTVGMIYVGLPENTEQEQFQVYPNPCQDRFYIESENPIQQMKIYDAFGRTWDESPFPVSGKKVVDVTCWPAAVYFLKIQTKFFTNTRKIIKL